MGVFLWGLLFLQKADNAKVNEHMMLIFPQLGEMTGEWIEQERKNILRNRRYVRQG